MLSTDEENDLNQGPSDVLSGVVRIFLQSNLSIILIIFSMILGVAALLVTPREEDPQIVVPLADIYVSFPGHSASEVEQLVSTPLERVLYQIDGVEYVYSMSRENQAIITVRFFVGQDRERSLVKLFKKIDENLTSVPPGVTGWVVKPVEIDDVPITTLTLKTSSPDGPSTYDSHALRRMGEELVERLAQVPQVSRAEVIGGEPRTVHLKIIPERLQGYRLSILEIQRAIQGANLSLPAGFQIQNDSVVQIETASSVTRPDQLNDLVVGVSDGKPVFLRDVVTVEDSPAEVVSYVRHGDGPARDFHSNTHASDHSDTEVNIQAVGSDIGPAVPAVTIAISKQKGANAVKVASRVLAAAEELKASVLPDDVLLLETRNYGHTANEKVNELVEGLGVAIVIVIALLTLSLGWREALIVAVAVPVVFGLTLAVNLLFGYTINRVTLFALILALGLLVDDPIVDVENIARHFEERKKASRRIVLEAVAEIRPPLISATLAVIVSFLPMFFITGMMGPYMSPMALNVPISMLMSMLVAFTITPWLCFHLLKGKANAGHATTGSASATTSDTTQDSAKPAVHDIYDPELVKQTFLYRFFKPIMVPMLKTRLRAIGFLFLMAALTLAAVGMAATRSVPLKMLPFDNKNEFLLVLDLDEGTSLERTSAVVAEFEEVLATVPEVTDFTSYVGTPGPIDFNGLVRHYYLRQSPNLAEIRVNLVGKKNRRQQSHAMTLRLRDQLTELAQKHQALVRLVELPPGPPVLASVVAEVYGQPDHSYQDLLDSAAIVSDRMKAEPGLVEVDDIREAAARKLVFVTDQEKAALAGVSVADIAATLKVALGGTASDFVRTDSERHPLIINLRLPQELRSSPHDLGQLHLKSASGGVIALSELGTWREARVDQTIYHKNLQPVVYVFAECAGRPPAECIVDVQADQVPSGAALPDRKSQQARPVDNRTYLSNGSGLAWQVPAGIDVVFSGEGEWKITLDVFRDLGLAFGAAMVMIYIILVAQTGSFLLPIVVMMAIPLTVIGVMPGFWMLNAISGSVVGGYADPVYFTATAMIGMIALAGIVTRDSIILVDFIELAIRHGRPLFDAILESRVVRLRPILLTAGAALLSSVPITLDPIFSGLGWSLIFGLISSTLFTLFVIPVSYWLLKANASSSTHMT
ncbi:MAG: efflux RND transporter permease subunit [Planctomycetaceae bacterium]